MNDIQYESIKSIVHKVLDERQKKSNYYIDNLWSEYLEYSIVVMAKESSTYANDETIYLKHIKPYFGKLKIYDITPKDIINWHLQMSDCLARRTIINNHKTLSKLFNWADRIYDTSWNPTNKVGVPKVGSKSAEFKIWTEEEFHKVYSKIFKLEHKVLMLLLYFCGFRRSEVIALRWNDLIGDYLRVDEAIVNVNGKMISKCPKNSNSMRLVQLDCQTFNILQELHSQQKNRSGFHPTNFIIGGEKPIGFETLRRVRKKYQEQTDVHHIKTHELRHSHVSFLINNKMPVIAIAQRIGDTIEEVMKTYSHLLPQSSMEIKKLLDNTTKYYK